MYPDAAWNIVEAAAHALLYVGEETTESTPVLAGRMTGRLRPTNAAHVPPERKKKALV
jgi:hypothetical protein